jgi:hypothetical protein
MDFDTDTHVYFLELGTLKSRSSSDLHMPNKDPEIGIWVYGPCLTAVKIIPRGYYLYMQIQVRLLIY